MLHHVRGIKSESIATLMSYGELKDASITLHFHPMDHWIHDHATNIIKD